MARPLRLVIALVALTAALASCGGREGVPPAVQDAGPVHVHGLGVDPADGALFVATHTGLFRAADGDPRAQRVADRYQDTMAFTVVGPRRFLGSGHPDGREGLPPFLGLIASEDSGQSWAPVSLQGEVDFHALRSAGRMIYGSGSNFRTRKPVLLASSDRGRTWDERRPPGGEVVSLVTDPADSSRLLAGTDRRLALSADAGREWRTLAGGGGYLAWPSSRRLYWLDGAGQLRSSADGGRRWRELGPVGGTPSAFEAAGPDELYAALHDGTIVRSGDGGRSWSVRSAP